MMSNILSVQDILKIAIKVEENGKNLYQALEGKEEVSNSMWQFVIRKTTNNQHPIPD